MNVSGNKCPYSAKFLPLIKHVQLQNPEGFADFLNENFENAAELYNRFTGNIYINDSPSPVEDVIQVDSKLGVKINSDLTPTSIDFYRGDNSRRKGMIRDFKSNMIASSIYNRDNKTNNIIQADAIEENGITVLNNLIFKYKLDLLNNILTFINKKTINNIESYDSDYLTNLFNKRIMDFEFTINSGEFDRNSQFYNAYNAYVILSKFDLLLEENTPFIEVKPELKKSEKFHVDKYNYRGPNMSFYTGFSTNEHMDASDHVSDLSKILLDYFPEINEAGEEISNTSITLSGFESTMSKVMLSIISVPEMKVSVNYNGEMQTFMEDVYYNGANADIAKILDTYLYISSKGKIHDNNVRTLLLNKVRAIRKFIYAPEMHKEIQNMFTGMMYKIVPPSYLTYELDNVLNVVTGKDLKERPIMGQRYAIGEMIQSAVDTFINNPDLYKPIKDKYNIRVTDNKIMIDEVINGYPYTRTMTYDKSESKTGESFYKIDINSVLSENALHDLAYSLLSHIIPEGTAEIAQQLNPLYSPNEWSYVNMYMPILGATILGINKIAEFKTFNNDSISKNKQNILDTVKFYSYIDDLANTLSVANGSDTVNVIKNSEGNNLPLYQIVSLAYLNYNIFNRIKEQQQSNKNRFYTSQENIIYKNFDKGLVLPPKIRSEAIVNGKVKTSDKLTVSEVLRLSIVHDFYQNLDIEAKKKSGSGIIGLQITTFADKSRHFIDQFDLNKSLSPTFHLKNELQKYFEQRKISSTSSAYDNIVKFLQESRNAEYDRLVKNIIENYNISFNENFTNLSQISKYISDRNLKQSDIQEKFVDKGLTFFLNTHGYTKDGKFLMNETIENFHKTFSNLKLTKERLENEKRKFIKNLIDNQFRLNTNDLTIKGTFGQYTNWFNKSTGEVDLVKIYDSSNNLVNVDNIVNLDNIIDNKDWTLELNPILEAYFITDNLLSNAYMNFIMGGVYAHDNKDKEATIGSKQYYQYGEASRLISQNKRAIIPGATYHPLVQNLPNGVLSQIRIAVMNDDQGKVFNMIGDKKYDLDSMDGSGFTSSFYSRLVNNSLLDARVGRDKKTIYHDINALYGNPVLLKWAEYELSNELRRFNPHGEISAENLFRKMHSYSLNKKIDVEKYFNEYANNEKNLHFYDYKQDKYFFISDIQNSDRNSNEAYRRLLEVNENGTIIGDYIEEYLPINTIYDLDQLFGGAFSMEYNDSYGRLINSELSTDIVFDIIVGEDLRDKMIAHLVNKSAIKVGAGNVNSESAWKDNTELLTMNMSTRFGGAQMNAEHELEFSEVTEMTQMLNALVQNGFTHDLVTQIYQNIGKVIVESMSKYSDAINTKDKGKLYEILAKSLIESFSTGDKDTLGLAQSFVRLAEFNLQQANLEYTLPFSANTINGAFIATTTSNLVKSGIRRKYAGIGAVLTPSNNIMQYFNINGKTITFKELVKIAKQYNVPNIFDENGKIVVSSIERLIDDMFIDGKLNPFIIPIVKQDIDFEDTIVIHNLFTGEYSNPTKVDDFETYDILKSITDPNIEFLNWTSKPKNLKDSNTFFNLDVIENGNLVERRFNIFDLDSVRASFYLNDVKSISDLLPEQLMVLQNAIAPYNINLIGQSPKTLVKELQKITQQQLESLTTGQTIPTSINFGVSQRTVLPKNVIVQPAQIIIGKLNASKLGLQDGDTISEIREQGERFFYSRMSGNYNITNPNLETFDFVLFDGNGHEVYVKYGSPEQISKLLSNYTNSPNPDYKINDDEVWYNEKYVSTSHDKQFHRLTDSNGKVHDYITINDIGRINELLSSELFDSYKTNYTTSNLDVLVKFNFKSNLDNNRPIRLRRYLDERIVDLTISNPNKFPISQLFDPNTLNQNEAIRFQEKLRQLSQNKFQSFERQLHYIGARIPTQSMQSFMPLEVVAFTDNDVNQVFVPKAQTWLQGSDYDVDKLYIMGYSLSNNGQFYSTSPLMNDFDINQVIKLPEPNGIKYTIGDGYVVTSEDLREYSLGHLEPFINILNSEFESVQFDKDVDSQLRGEFIQDLNRHSTSKLSSYQKGEGLKNKIVNDILRVITDPRNQINLHVPINMNDAQDAASRSLLGKSEKTMTADDPSTKFIMQSQFAEGKQVIGIEAVSMKAHSILTNYYNIKFRQLILLIETGNYNDIIKSIDSLIFDGSFDDGVRVLANLELSPLVKAINQSGVNEVKVDSNILTPIFQAKWKNYLRGDLLNIKSIINTLSNIADVDDALLVLSGLLSAATDNAKELILSKINATTNYADIYNYLISAGYSFNFIADIMTSEIFNHIVKLAEPNIFNEQTYDFSLKNAINFYLNEEMLPITDKNTLEKIVIEFLNSKEKLTFKDKIVNDIITKYKTTKKLENNFHTIFTNKFVNEFNKYLTKKIETTNTRRSIEQNFNEDEQVDDNLSNEERQQVRKKWGRDFSNDPIVKDDYLDVYTLMKYVNKRDLILTHIENKTVQINNLKNIINKIIPATEEMQILGSMTGINQGIRTNSYEKYSYVKRIENFINRRIQNYNEENPDNKISEFKLFDFLSNDIIKEQYINDYEKIKTSHNILAAITTVPHFNEMFKILYYDNKVITWMSIKNRLEYIFADQVLGDSAKKLNNVEFKELGNYVNDLLIYKWITNLNKEFNVPIGQSYFADITQKLVENSVENFKVNLNTIEGIASFKKLMDDYIIPSLKNDERFQNNNFIKNISRGINETRFNVNRYWKLPINMMQIDTSVKNSTFYESMLSGFNNLNGQIFNDWNIVDMFYLYNLITNKDAFGPRSMTRIFEDLVNSLDESLLVKQFYKYLAEIDGDQNFNLKYNLYDLRYRLALVSDNPEWKYNTKIYSNGIITFDSDTDRETQFNAVDINSAFTLNLPHLTSSKTTQVLPITEIVSKDSRYYKNPISVRQLLMDVSNSFFGNYEGGLQIVRNEDLANEDSQTRNAKGFIKNGVVYVNIDKADLSTPFHENAHLVMAGLKFKHPDIYYNLLSLVDTHPLYKTLKDNPHYANKHGSDLNEEVFVTLMSEYFKNKLYDWNSNGKLLESSDVILNTLQTMFKVNTENANLQSLMGTSLETVLYNFGSLLTSANFDSVINFESTILNQRIATLKDKLIAENIIDRNCYE